MKKINGSKGDKRRLVLNLSRYVADCDAIAERHADAASLDAGFDGGEFSGPAHGRLERKEKDEAARRHGFANADVADTCVDAFLR